MAIEAPERHAGGDADDLNREQTATTGDSTKAERVTPAEMVRRQLDLYDQHTHQRQVMDVDQMVEAARKRVQESGQNFDEMPVDAKFDAMQAEKDDSVAKKEVDRIIGDVKHMVAIPASEFQRKYNEEFKAQLAEARGEQVFEPQIDPAPAEPVSHEPVRPAMVKAPMLGTLAEPRYRAVDEDTEPTVPIPVVKPKLRHRAAHVVRRLFGRGRRKDKTQE